MTAELATSLAAILRASEPPRVEIAIGETGYMAFGEAGDWQAISVSEAISAILPLITEARKAGREDAALWHDERSALYKQMRLSLPHPVGVVYEHLWQIEMEHWRHGNDIRAISP